MELHAQELPQEGGKRMTNGDRVRQMSDEELAELWDGFEYDRKYVPECFENGDCDHEGYVCECCPKTFLNWLKAEAEGEK